MRKYSGNRKVNKEMCKSIKARANRFLALITCYPRDLGEKSAGETYSILSHVLNRVGYRHCCTYTTVTAHSSYLNTSKMPKENSLRCNSNTFTLMMREIQRISLNARKTSWFLQLSDQLQHHNFFTCHSQMSSKILRKPHYYCLIPILHHIWLKFLQMFSLCFTDYPKPIPTAQ